MGHFRIGAAMASTTDFKDRAASAPPQHSGHSANTFMTSLAIIGLYAEEGAAFQQYGIKAGRLDTTTLRT
jgi:hypothetical protein